MNRIPCPNCGFQASEGASRCGSCGQQLTADVPNQTIIPPPPASSSVSSAGILDVISRIVWGVALFVIGFSLLDYASSISLAQSAPQQAAAAGMTCVWVLGAYVGARGFDEITRPGRR